MHHTRCAIEHAVSGRFAQKGSAVSFLAYHLILNYGHLVDQASVCPKYVVKGEVNELTVVLLQVFIEELTGYIYGHLLGSKLI